MLNGTMMFSRKRCGSFDAKNNASTKSNCSLSIRRCRHFSHIVALFAISLFSLSEISVASAIQLDGRALTAYMGRYPDYVGDVTESVAQVYFNDGKIDIFEALPSDCVNCKVHIHNGTTCASADDVGGHFWNNLLFSEDPWVEYSQSYNTTSGTNATFLMDSGYDLDMNLGHALVLHSNDTRIACGILFDDSPSQSLAPTTDAADDANDNTYANGDGNDNDTTSTSTPTVAPLGDSISNNNGTESLAPTDDFDGLGDNDTGGSPDIYDTTNPPTIEPASSPTNHTSQSPTYSQDFLGQLDDPDLDSEDFSDIEDLDNLNDPDPPTSEPTSSPTNRQTQLPPDRDGFFEDNAPPLQDDLFDDPDMDDGDFKEDETPLWTGDDYYAVITSPPTKSKPKFSNSFSPTKSPIISSLQGEVNDFIDTEKNEIKTLANDRTADVLAILLAIFGLVGMVLTAWQIMENPDGLCTSCCRLAVKATGFLLKIVFLPCRLCCSNGKGYTGPNPNSPDNNAVFMASNNFNSGVELT